MIKSSGINQQGIPRQRYRTRKNVSLLQVLIHLFFPCSINNECTRFRIILEMDSGHKRKKIGPYLISLRPFLRILCVALTLSLRFARKYRTIYSSMIVFTKYINPDVQRQESMETLKTNILDPI